MIRAKFEAVINSSKHSECASSVAPRQLRPRCRSTHFEISALVTKVRFGAPRRGIQQEA